MKRRLLCCWVIIAVLALVTPITTNYYYAAIAAPAAEKYVDKTPYQIPAVAEKQEPVYNRVQIQPVMETRNNLPILMYHEIGDGPNSLYVSDQEFNKQMNYLYENQYTVVSLAQAVDMINNKTIPKKTVALTFDDGYQSFYDKVWPALQKCKFNATVYVITGKLDSPPFMTMDEVKTLAENGVEIGCHTRNHPSLNTLPASQMYDEIVQARLDIEMNTGIAVQSFCYPSGQHRQLAVDTVRQNGYIAAVTTQYGLAGYNNDIYLLPRVRIPRGLSLEEFVGRIQ